MNRTSISEFQNSTRIHIGLHTSDLSRAISFYSLLLGAKPVKVKADYAKFETADPSLNLSLTERESLEPADGMHYGIQVKTTEAVADFKQRLENAGLAIRAEETSVCCYALQDKFWVSDPDGVEWEVFVVLEDAQEFISKDSTCCDTEADPVGERYTVPQS